MEDTGESIAKRLVERNGVQRFPSDQIELLQLRDFVPTSLQQELIALIDAERRPSTIADDNGDQYFRTSETCDLPPDNLAVMKVEALLKDLSGIDPKYGEPLQGQRYAEGQEFKAHTDYFSPSGQDFEKYCSVAGQRTWTFMIYLNKVEAGGGTRFKVLKKVFQPEAGKLLCWNNRRSDTSVNPNTLHHGMKVRKGLKYILTKWYREREWI
ncbi:prolyl hydroxylase family protein [Pontixanthobacter gangjinensis]|uniref:Oxygenase n=1 Tax=Pontixanthobacter gangjinensis TaxID=1028742 RepID=A0A6I4SNP4_9SPHN|nr:2OG-Fe(II) oxygenase [Pontixanthobacter gangjinensis]MXO57334.1 oxygenase [Pontixanthobacter gangjinensis]